MEEFACFYRSSIEGEDLTVFGDGSQTRSFYMLTI